MAVVSMRSVQSPIAFLCMIGIGTFVLLTGGSKVHACPVDTFLPHKTEFKKTSRYKPLWYQKGSDTLIFAGPLEIDMDGAATAYHPDAKTGIDHICNGGKAIVTLNDKEVAYGAGQSRLCLKYYHVAKRHKFRNPRFQFHWWGVVTKQAGVPTSPPMKQLKGSYTAYYASPTTLQNPKIAARHDQTKYVDALKIPFFVLPGNLGKIGQSAIRPGDVGVVHRNGKTVFAVFADSGPAGKFGEGSYALAEALVPGSMTRQISRWGRVRGGLSQGNLFVVFPRTRGTLIRTWKDDWPITLSRLRSVASAAFEKWGGADALKSCASRFLKPSPVFKLVTPRQRHPLIRKINARLRVLGYLTGGVSDIFDRRTRTAVIRFQNESKLKSDGEVGAQTAAALGIPLL